ncbi:MAG: phytanoyl-CoA dioxygenase family protein, partial [Coleofasciculus sp. S288]|nr:phytanoyl-CoA dioxygenase family protein [Coleofasciculus sp. S288]
MYELDFNQRQQLLELGWVVIPGVVPKLMVRKVLRAINASIGTGMDTDKLETYHNQSFCPELCNHPLLIDLFMATPAMSLTESVIGDGKVDRPRTAQIGLRFPVQWREPSALSPHIDGFYTPQNGVRKGRIASFTALAGFYLNDVEEDWAGNFTVWSGTHQMFGEYFKSHPPDPELKDGIPPIDLPKPLQVKAKAGDMILCHYLLAHAAASNLSPWVRYAVFFRLKPRKHDRL